jgi:hypothetical protein
MSRKHRAARGRGGAPTTSMDAAVLQHYYTTRWDPGVLNLAKQLRQRPTADLLADLALIRRAPSSLTPLARVRVQLTLAIVDERERRGAA